jgi:hypothetical protein
MHRLLTLTALALGITLSHSTPAQANRAVITTTAEGRELTIVVHGVTDYCSTNARTDVLRRGDTIRIVRDRPTVVSRCLTQRDLTFVVRDVPAGTYNISYEQTPLLAPARFLKVASAIVTVSDP